MNWSRKLKMKFNIGALVLTKGITFERNRSEEFSDGINEVLDRYISGDWGDLDEEDCKTNEFALKHGERLLGAYHVCDKKIYIITEYDRSITTILLAEEY